MLYAEVVIKHPTVEAVGGHVALPYVEQRGGDFFAVLFTPDRNYEKGPFHLKGMAETSLKQMADKFRHQPPRNPYERQKF